MSPAFEISSRRLTLRLIPPTDAIILNELFKESPSLHQWLDWCHKDICINEVNDFLLVTRVNWVKGQAFDFGVYEYKTQCLLGMVAITELYPCFNMASLGYWIGDAHQNNGYGKEAIKSLAAFCFNKLNLTRLEIVCDPRNIASNALIKSIGARKESLARNRFIFNGQPRTGIVYSLIPSDIT
ncbi:GNAT family N-acetyltransferase [Vibrio sagamiensis]|uniref:Ribosomal-protein-serine acetyltransferase n=1 Tax=Vibrio sagamiensis NBRC 104589 TaxID=1219064 RepID=A0A511QC47_9VIBR|nr:GNAT family protein [Vibrio sagamiensis]PNQ70256.1 N-acetyltransferase [Vibrio agarivorans]GEM74871.1 ribosomal-protein-serine acetyltransferase [Vibrio sagamiensis NBRC 104589]